MDLGIKEMMIYQTEFVAKLRRIVEAGGTIWKLPTIMMEALYPERLPSPLLKGKLAPKKVLLNQIYFACRDGNGGGAGQQWNVMEPKDFLEPRVFLCKAGRFLENLNAQMGGEGVVKERLGNEKFQESCDLNDLRQIEEETEESENGTESPEDVIIIADEGEFDEDKVEVIEVKDPGSSAEDKSNGNQTDIEPIKNDKLQELPILVFEGLPEPRLDQTEEDLVQSVLEKYANIPEHSVRTALRLPIKQFNGKSLVIVEMDTMENEEKVIKKRTTIRQNPDFDHVGIRKAQYQELWKFIEELTIAKRVVFSQQQQQQPEVTSSTMATADEEDSADEQTEIAEIIERDSAQFPNNPR